MRTAERGVAGLLALFVTACGGAAPAARTAATDPDPLTHITSAELFRRGVMLGRAGDFTRAEQYLSASMERGEEEERVLPVLLEVCVRASRMSAALTYAEPYLARHPGNFRLRLLTATIHMGMGEHARARDELERVIADAPSGEAQEAHYFLGVLYRDGLPDRERSREHFGHYLEIAPEGEHAEEARAELRRPERVESGESRGATGPVRVPMPEQAAAPEEGS